MAIRKNSTHHYAINHLHEYNINCETREVWLCSYEGNVEEEPGIDYRSTVKTEKNLTFLAGLSNELIILHMHSDGGSWNDGMSLYDTIKQIAAPVLIVAYSQASSMTSVILQAGDLRLMMPHTQFMFHNGNIRVSDNFRGVHSYIEFTKKEQADLLNIYADRCLYGAFFEGKSRSSVKSYLRRKMESKQDVYLSAKDAVYWGFADGIVGEDYEMSSDIIRGNIDVPKSEKERG